MLGGWAALVEARSGAGVLARRAGGRAAHLVRLAGVGRSHALVCAVVVASALLADTVLGRFAEPDDVLASARTRFSAAHLVAVALLLALRLFLLLLAPGWVLYVLVRQVGCSAPRIHRLLK